MEVKKIYDKDLNIAKALINRDAMVTYRYFYVDCYPLFKSIYDNYYTDCEDCKEFIDEIYVVLVAPSKKTGKCQMEKYRGESTLRSWIKIACLCYCYKKFKRKGKMPVVERLPYHDEEDDGNYSDRIDAKYGSYEIDLTSLNRQDAIVILEQMPNKRYAELILLRYLEQKTNEETAEALGMSMENYYNKHKLAREQYERIYRKEGHNEFV